MGGRAHLRDSTKGPPVPSVRGRGEDALDEASRSLASARGRALDAVRTANVHPRMVLQAALAVFLLTFFVRWGTGRDLRDVAQVLVAVVAGGACATAARRHTGKTKLAWWFLAGGAGLWAAGRAGWSFQGTPSAEAAGSASSSDVGNLATALCILVGLLLLVDGPPRPITRVRALVEGLMIGCCTLFVSWTLVFRTTFESTSPMAPLDRTVLLSQPMLQIAVFSMLLASSTRMLRVRSQWWLPLAVGLGAVMVADAAFVPLSSLDPVVGIRLDDIGRIGGFALVIVAAARSWSPLAGEVHPPSARRTRLLTAVPSVSAVAVLGGASTYRLTGEQLDPALVWIALGVLCLSVVLHIVVIVESDQLSAELSTAHDEAIQASITKSHFLATVSHEIRTPLTAITGFADLLVEAPGTPDDQRAMVESIASHAREVATLIEDLLVASQGEGVVLEVAEGRVDLAAEVVAVLAAGGAFTETVRVDPFPEDTIASGDGVRLRQIVRNLLTNAHRHGGADVRIRVLRDAAGAGIDVVDNGPGVPAADRERIFDQYQTASRHPYAAQSMGIGLTVSRQLAQLMGGTLEYRRDGDLSVFSLRLPDPE